MKKSATRKREEFLSLPTGKQQRESKRHKILALLLGVILLLGVLSGCAKGEDSVSNEIALQDNVSGSTATGNKDISDGGGKNPAEIGESIQGADSSEYEIKIIRTADVSAESKNFDEAIKEIEDSVSALGGYIESSQIQGRNYHAKSSYSNRSATFSLRIPAEKLDEFLSEAGELLNVTSSSTSAEDISGEYYDIEARLSVLETERQVLEDMLAKASSLDNMIKIEDRLYDVIYEIESYKTMLKIYDSKVAYSTVTLRLYEVADLTVVDEGNSFGSRLKKAVKESWQNFTEFCKDAVIWFVYALPAILIFAVIFVIGALLIVKLSKKRRNTTKGKSAEKSDKEEKEENKE